jgi:RND family efflux transporter MFP subunit
MAHEGRGPGHGQEEAGAAEVVGAGAPDPGPRPGARGRARRLLRAVAPVALVLAGGVAVAVLLVRTRPTPAPAPRGDGAALVEVRTVTAETRPISVAAQGTVLAAREVVLQAEVGGRVVWTHENLVPGGRLRAGDTVVRLDARAYELAAGQARAQIARAQADLALEQSRQEMAAREWELFRRQRDSALGEAPPLVLRQPQLEAARGALTAARRTLERAELDVARTRLRAPFDAYVRGNTVQVGQLVGPQTTIATLVGTDRFWVQVAIPLPDLRWVAVPGVNAAEGQGARAVVRQEVGGARVEREGQVERLVGELDPASRLARVLVAITQPLDPPAARAARSDGAAGGEAGLPLLPGAYVNVALDAGALDDVIAVPRVALVEQRRVLVAGPDDRLQVREVEVQWSTPDEVLVRAGEGLRPGERLVVSELPGAVPGMPLRPVPAPEAPPPATAAPGPTAGDEAAPAPQPAAAGDDEAAPAPRPAAAGDDDRPAGGEARPPAPRAGRRGGRR